MPRAISPFWRMSKVPEAVVAEQGWRNCSLLEALSEGNGRLVASLGHGVMVHDPLSGSWLERNKEVCIGTATLMFICAGISRYLCASSFYTISEERFPWLCSFSLLKRN